MRLWVGACLLLSSLVVSGMPAAGAETFRLAFERESLTQTILCYEQTIDGVPVAGSARIETTRAGGAPTLLFERTAHRSATLSAASAGARRGTPAWVNVGGEARPAYLVVSQARRMEPYARYYDAETDALLREEPLFFTARARVFDINPVAGLNDTSLRDRNDAASAVPESAYSQVDLDDLATNSPLSGPDVAIVDREAPFTPHADASVPLTLLDRSRPEFEEVNAYFQVARSQRYLRSLGYAGARQLVAYAVPVDAHAANGTDNSYFVIEGGTGRGALYFGDGGTDDAEDSDIVLHEFAHAIHTWIAPGALSGPSSSQARAISEGFADYWAFSSTFEAASVSGRDAFCIADWDARCAGDDPSQNCGYREGSDCLRRVDSTKTMSGYVSAEAAGTEYLNAEIWSSALREVFMVLVGRRGASEARRLTDTLVLESLFGLPPAPVFRDVATRMIEADRALRGGAEIDAICGAMTARAIFGAGECAAVPKGEWTLFPSVTGGLDIPDAGAEALSRVTVADPRRIAHIAVQVNIRHPNRGDLAVALIAPDGTRVVLEQSSQMDRSADVRATFGIDAASAASLSILEGMPAAGVWTLAVRDVYAGDAGHLRSWGIEIEFEGDQPVTMRPAFSSARYVPAGHVTGAAGQSWMSDLTLFNRGSRTAVVTLIFTPSGADGRSNFAALRVSIATGATVVLADVVPLLQMSGTGSLAIAPGEGADVIAMSRAWFERGGGTFGDGFLPVTGSKEAVVPRLVNDAASRSSFGWLETAGAAGMVEVEIFDTSTGLKVATRELPVLPFGHGQMPVEVPGGHLLARITVVSGAALVAGYASVTDRVSGDSVTFAGQALPAERRSVVAPVIRAAGATTSWRTSAWVVSLVDAAGPVTRTLRDSLSGARSGTVIPLPEAGRAVSVAGLPDSFVFGSMRLDLPAGAIPTGEVRSDMAGQQLPFFSGPPGHDVVGIEVSADFRSNAGVLNPNETVAYAAILVYDAAGSLMRRIDLAVPPSGVIQVPLEPGAARLSIEGPVYGYASAVDNGSGDGTTVPAQ